MSDERAREETSSERLAALEAGLAEVRRELVELRRLASQRLAEQTADEPPASSAQTILPQLPALSRSAWDETRAGARARSSRPLIDRPSTMPITGRADLESLIGRYGTLASAAAVILLGVGTLVVWAVQRGLLTPEIRVALGAVATACVAVAGLYFRRRNERRYGNVLLALSLAMADVVAWGAGPRLHLVPTGVTLALVDGTSLALAALAVRDESEFLFAVAVAGALSAPFVTADRPGQMIMLLGYGAAVELGALRASRLPSWWRSAVLLVAGAAAYVLSAASLPVGSALLDPYAIPLFGGVLAAGALIAAEPERRGALARSFLAVSLLGVLIGWDAVPSRPLGLSLGVAVALAAVICLALWIDEPGQRLWVPSAFVLPMLSLGVALSATRSSVGDTVALGAWASLSFAMWYAERARNHSSRAGAHFLLGAGLAGLAVANQLWPDRLMFVAGLSTLGLVLVLLARGDIGSWPMFGGLMILVGAALLAVDQLGSRLPYAYTPFATRSSASAAIVTVALAGAAWWLGESRSAGWKLVPRWMRAGVPIGFALLWGRFEIADAFSRDVATFLLTLYYAAVGVAAIVVGRRLGVAAPRIVGLALALYAALKAVIETSDISALSLRVGCYAAVGVFLLGAGFMYRDASSRRAAAAE